MQEIIERVWEDRSLLSRSESREAIREVIELLDKEMRSMKDTDAFDMMIEFDKKLTKIINKYLKEQ